MQKNHNPKRLTINPIPNSKPYTNPVLTLNPVTYPIPNLTLSLNQGMKLF